MEQKLYREKATLEIFVMVFLIEIFGLSTKAGNSPSGISNSPVVYDNLR